MHACLQAAAAEAAGARRDAAGLVAAAQAESARAIERANAATAAERRNAAALREEVTAARERIRAAEAASVERARGFEVRRLHHHVLQICAATAVDGWLSRYRPRSSACGASEMPSPPAKP